MLFEAVGGSGCAFLSIIVILEKLIKVNFLVLFILDSLIIRKGAHLLWPSVLVGLRLGFELSALLAILSNGLPIFRLPLFAHLN